MQIFDQVSNLEAIRLSGELAQKLTALVAEKAKSVPDALRLISLTRDIPSILAKLGASTQKQADLQQEPAPADGGARFFPVEQRRTKGARQKDNDAAVSLLNSIQAEGRGATDQERAVLARFSGYGGGLVDPEGKEGSPYEYYTPPVVASGVWSLLSELGFQGGKVLDPSAGTGVFAATRPKSVAIDQVELSPLSGGVNKLVNDGETSKTVVSPFEAVAGSTPDETYDAVVTNVPFGDASLREHANKDSKLRDASLEAYFILRSLDKLKPGGFAAFITPPRVVSGADAKMEDLRFQISMRSEFMGAYRLPNKVFQDASDADTIVDVIVMRKHSKEAREKIGELAEQDIESLRKTNVLWEEFLAGRYFRGEGRKFQLGEFVAKDPSKLRDVDRVVSDTKDTAAIAKMMRKFGGSRIDWAALDAAEAAPILYRDGDVIYQDGRTLEYREGRFIALQTDDSGEAMASLGNKLETPLQAVNQRVSFADAAEFVRYMTERSKALDIPDWLTMTVNSISKLPEGVRPGWWEAQIAGQAAINALREHAQSEPFKYDQTYPALTTLLMKVAGYGKKSEGVFPQLMKDAAKTIGVIVSKRKGFFARWTGAGQADVEIGDLTPEKAYEKLKYEAGDDFGFVPIEKLSASQGQEFDPMNDDAWCISPDGKSVMRANDYYQGNYQEFLNNIVSDFNAATDAAVKEKILRQRDMARSRLVVPDVDRMTFNLFSPFVPVAQKVEFLRDNVDSRFGIDFGEDGKAKIIIDIGSPKNERERQLKRYAEHLRVGTLTTRTTAAETDANPQLEASRLAQLREMVSGNNAKFNIWVKSNPGAYEAIKAKLTDPNTLYFQQVDDESPLDIPGMNPALSLHGYQNAEVRRQGKKFGGINGFDVGLGKTFTALAATQYAQSIGVKRKTVFVVPNAVLSNWRKEASRAYTSTDDCLFVGMDIGSDGSVAVSSSNYARDMHRILENKHRKVFMTLEAFKSIPMRDETLEAYQSYIAGVDPSFAEASEKKAEEIRKAKKQQKLTDSGTKSAALPFFEDMGFDSVVIDEAHMAKNSKLLLDFQSAKYLADATASDRGLDMQVKAWYVRGQSPNRDGVMALTATPVTNSPLEIYGMLTLAVGEEELNRRLGIMGADDFMNAFSEIQQLEEPDLVGRPRAGRVFLGLQNVTLLRTALQQIANIKNADDVGSAVAIPDEDPMPTRVDLDDESKRKLALYKQIYVAARAMENEDATPEQEAMVLAYSEKTGEPPELLAHPFNLINKMSRLIMDPELELGTVYTVNAAQLDQAKTVVDRFNSKGIIEKRVRPGLLTDPKNVTVRKKKGDEEKTETVIKVQAWIKSGQIIIDTDDFDTQSKFLELADKAGLDLDVKVSPKLAAFMENFKKEQASPKAGGIAKQIIFCDMLGMHNKIKMLLVKRCGIPAGKIGTINAKAVSDPADMQDLQDGFNADGEENRYIVIIANKKGEVGINLQKGTQAIHHLTIGWTPDALTQRNGRGVRQGNYLSKVTVYHYDANGTFDEYKRMLVGKKDTWITDVMGRGADGDNVRIAGGLSEKEMNDLIMASGDADAMSKARAQIERRERERQTAAAREAQVQTLRVVSGQKAWLAKYSDATKWRNAKINEYVDLANQADTLEIKIGRTKNESVRARIERQKADIDARLGAVEALLRGATVDCNGKPTGDLGYRISQYGRNKGSAEPYGNVAGDSELAKRYEAEKQGVNKALQTARAEYKAISKRPGAYTEDTLDVFERGDGAVIGGVLLTTGMVGRHKSEYWIAASPSKLVHPPTGREMESSAAISGFEFVGPADADEDWHPVAEACAIFDEQTIAENNAEGFNIGDKRLYSTFSADIAGRVKAIPAGVTAYPNNITLKSPFFPVPIDPEQAASALLKSVAQKQAEAVEWIASTDNWNRGIRLVRVKNIAIQDERPSGFSAGAALIRYCVANGERMTYADFKAIDRYSDINSSIDVFNPEFRRGFDKALADGTQAAKTAADLEEAVFSFVRAAFPFFEFNDEFSEAQTLTIPMESKLDKAIESIKAGGKPVIWLDQIFSSVYQYVLDIAEKRMTVENLVENGALVGDDKIREILTGIIVGNPFDGLDGAFMVEEAVRDAVISNFKGDKPDGFVLLTKKSVIDLAWSKFEWGGLRRVKAAANSAIASQQAGGIDLDAMIKKAGAVRGVTTVAILSKTVIRPNKPWHGSFAYEPNKAVVIGTVRNSSLSDRMSEKDGGLEGRYFERGIGWVFSIKSGEQDSKGKPVASLEDFLSFVGELEEA